jgi:hypothetical protein
MMGGPGLLTNKSVQQELKLSDDQVKKIEQTVQEVRQKHMDEFQALRDLDPQERREKGGALFRKVGEETQKALSGVLNPDQEKRFKQIELQVRGPRAFTDPEVQKTLNLTADQQEKIKTINQDAEKQMSALRPGPGGGGGEQRNPEEMRKKMTEMRKETMSRSMEVLTDDQKKQWKEMTGEPFEVKFERRGPRGGGAGGGR